MAIQTITKDNFDAQVKNQAGPVLLDFWASWCGPCRMMSPILEQFAQLHPEVAVGKVNVDEQRELASAFGMKASPPSAWCKEASWCVRLLEYRPSLSWKI